MLKCSCIIFQRKKSQQKQVLTSNNRKKVTKSIVYEKINSMIKKVAGVKGLEPSTYRVTGDRSNQLSYTPTLNILVGGKGLEPLTPSV